MKNIIDSLIIGGTIFSNIKNEIKFGADIARRPMRFSIELVIYACV